MSHAVGEYSLKGFLMLNKKRIPKVHDLLTLLSHCERIAPEFNELREYCNSLNKYKEESTYPAEPPVVIGVEEAKESIEYAIKINEFCLKKAEEWSY